jgi:archaellum biogenesis ATPase FlaH
MIEIAVINFLYRGGENYIPYISQHMFTSEIGSYLIDITKRHFDKHKVLPSIDDLKLSLYERFPESEDKKRIRKYLRQMKNQELSTEFTSDLIGDLIQKSQLRKFIQNAIPQLDSLEPLNLDSLRLEFEKLINSNCANGECILKLSEVERRDRDATNAVPTCSNKLNFFLDPGLAPGEMGIIQANPGIGKTLLSINFASAGARCGFSVWYVTLDEMDQDIASRMDDHISNFVKKGKIPKWIDNIHIIDFSEGRKVVDLGILLERFGAPGLVIIDGTDEFLDSSSKEYRHQIGNIYKSIRRLSRNKNHPFPVWLTTQSTAASEGKLRKGQFDMGENKVTKAAEASVIVSVNQTEEEFEEGVARLYIGKIRRKKGKFKTIQIEYNQETQLVKDIRDVDDDEYSVSESLKKGNKR